MRSLQENWRNSEKPETPEQMMQAVQQEMLSDVMACKLDQLPPVLKRVLVYEFGMEPAILSKQDFCSVLDISDQDWDFMKELALNLLKEMIQSNFFHGLGYRPG